MPLISPLLFLSFLSAPPPLAQCYLGSEDGSMGKKKQFQSLNPSSSACVLYSGQSVFFVGNIRQIHFSQNLYICFFYSCFPSPDFLHNYFDSIVAHSKNNKNGSSICWWLCSRHYVEFENGLSHWMYSIIIWGSYCYCPHLTDEDTKSQTDI